MCFRGMTGWILTHPAVTPLYLFGNIGGIQVMLQKDQAACVPEAERKWNQRVTLWVSAVGGMSDTSEFFLHTNDWENIGSDEYAVTFNTQVPSATVCHH